MEVLFRLAAPDDLRALLEFMRQFYAIDGYPFEENAIRVALTDIVGNEALGRVWLINDGIKDIGYIVVTFGYSLEYHGRDAFIDELFIEAHHRAQGIGTKTLQFVLDACREHSVHALHLEVERTNVAGLSLYRKFGFEAHDRHLMTRWLIR